MKKFEKESIKALKDTKKWLVENNLRGVKNELTFSIKKMFKRTERISKARPHDRVGLYNELNGNIIRICSVLIKRHS